MTPTVVLSVRQGSAQRPDASVVLVPVACRYDKGNPEHRQIKKQIEEGDGLPDTAYTWEMDAALRQVRWVETHYPGLGGLG